MLVDVIEPGTVVGAFRVESLLGRGGMASVYRAVQIRLDRPVALKILNPALAADEKFFQRFQIEGINAARLDHPNIVPVYEAGEDAGYAFLAMKLIDGEAFNSVIARRRRLPPPETVRVLTDVAHALDYAHGMGFIHRDVKPGNVLIDSNDNVFLSDFGLSKDMGTRGITATGQWMGTAEYMAPEQAAGKDLDYRADLYALGCVAFECLTGDPPFVAENPFAVMMAHANSEIPQATRHDPSLPEGVDRVLRRAMSKDREERYPAALALVESLACAAEARPLTEMAEPQEGFELYSGPHTPPRARSSQDDRDVAGGPGLRGSAPPSPAALVCPRCAGEVDTEDVYCGACGVRVRWCPSCRGPRTEAERFCAFCGTGAPPVDRRGV